MDIKDQTKIILSVNLLLLFINIYILFNLFTEQDDQEQVQYGIKLGANPIKSNKCSVYKIAKCTQLEGEHDVCGGQYCCTPKNPSKDYLGTGCIPRDCADEFGGCAN